METERTSIWLRPERGSRGRAPEHTRDGIAAVAVRLADSDGLGAVTIRSVAEALGSGSASLYRYVESRDELVALMVDQVNGELDHTVTRPRRLARRPPRARPAEPRRSTCGTRGSPTRPPRRATSGRTPSRTSSTPWARCGDLDVDGHRKLEAIGVFSAVVRLLARTEIEQRGARPAAVAVSSRPPPTSCRAERRPPAPRRRDVSTARSSRTTTRPSGCSRASCAGCSSPSAATRRGRSPRGAHDRSRRRSRRPGRPGRPRTVACGSITTCSPTRAPVPTRAPAPTRVPAPRCTLLPMTAPAPTTTSTSTQLPGPTRAPSCTTAPASTYEVSASHAPLVHVGPRARPARHRARAARSARSHRGRPRTPPDP